MSSFTAFQNELLVAAYDLSERTAKDLVLVGDLFEKYPLNHRPNWIMRALFDFRDHGYISDGLTHDPEMQQSFWLTASGLREAERLVESGVNIANADDFSGATRIEGRMFAGEGSPPEDLMRDGDIWFEYAPSSDGLVKLDHNQPDVQEVTRHFELAREELRASNEVGSSVDERDRLVRSLDAAISLWQSAQLKLMQIRVGILMVVDDLAQAFKDVGAKTSVSILSDLIKKFVKDMTGLDI